MSKGFYITVIAALAVFAASQTILVYKYSVLSERIQTEFDKCFGFKFKSGGTEL